LEDGLSVTLVSKEGINASSQVLDVVMPVFCAAVIPEAHSMEAPDTVPPRFAAIITHSVIERTQHRMGVQRRSTGRQYTASIFFAFALLLFAEAAISQTRAVLFTSYTSANEFVVVISSKFHSDYGCSYPLTYQLDIPQSLSGLKAERRSSSSEAWMEIQEKTANDFFNGIEAVRFDYLGGRAYVSAAFSSGSDSLFLRISESSGKTITPRYAGIAYYYDNRRAAVTVTADDWSDWGDLDHRFTTLISLFRSFNLYLTVGVISGTSFTTRPTWGSLQQQLDSGFVEVASHSRTHVHTPYADPEGEINGGYDDLVNNLTLPPTFRKNIKQYVYTWIAPYGDYDSLTDTMLQTRKYLVPRLYLTGDTSLSAWDEKVGHFKTCNPTLEIGKPSWGGGDTDRVYLNSKFDSIKQRGGVYHFMWHPQVLFDDLHKSYLSAHLSYISNRKDILYANMGHLYLYRLLQLASNSTTVSVKEANALASGFALEQNYPNPFNPSTTIAFSLSESGLATLEIFDVLGRRVKTVFKDMYQSIGRHYVVVDLEGYSSGVYYYGFRTGSQRQLKPMIFVK
jgi:hypothetical protein